MIHSRIGAVERMAPTDSCEAYQAIEMLKPADLTAFASSLRHLRACSFPDRPPPTHYKYFRCRHLGAFLPAPTLRSAPQGFASSSAEGAVVIHLQSSLFQERDE